MLNAKLNQYRGVDTRRVQRPPPSLRITKVPRVQEAQRKAAGRSVTQDIFRDALDLVCPELDHVKDAHDGTLAIVSKLLLFEHDLNLLELAIDFLFHMDHHTRRDASHEKGHGHATHGGPEQSQPEFDASVNASGHRDQLKRVYSLLEICGLALTIDNAWIAFAGSLQISLLNGGPPGILYEYIVACVYYTFIGLSISELASSIPSSGGVYHWASVTPGPRYGRVLGFFTGSLNFFGWIFDLASIATIPANVLVQMYAVFHPDFIIEAWHSYVAFVCIIWLVTAFVIFCNGAIPYLQHVGLFLILAGGLITIIVVASMPRQHASNAFVWIEFNNLTGWGNGVAFLTGVLNGAFAIGTPDSVTHMAEELPNPRHDLPKAIMAQICLGFVTAFVFGIAIFYGINDLDAVIGSTGSFPLGEIYAQATGSRAATFGLLLIVFLSIMICVIGTVTMVGRLWWTLARDNATPFAQFFSTVDERRSCPIYATILCSVLTTGFGAIQLGSKTAFTVLVSSFITLTTASYLLAILPNVLTGRSNVPRGPFWMAGAVGYIVNASACVLIVFFNVFFCFPFAYPVTVSLMNYNSVILVGIMVLTTIWWFIHGGRHYPGPKVGKLYLED